MQTCEQGSIEWIEATEEDEHPAPMVMIADAAGTTGSTTTTTEAATTTTAEPTTTAADAGEPIDAGGKDPSPLVLLGIVAVSLVVVGAIIAVARGQRDKAA